MSAKREILFLAHRIPYPPDKGDKIRSWRMLSHLAERYDVHLGCFVDDPADFQHVGAVEAKVASAAFIPLRPRLARIKSVFGLVSGAPLSFAYYDDRRMRTFVRETRQRDLAAEIAFSSSMAPYLAKAKAPRVVDLCDADSEKWRHYAEISSGLMRAIYQREAKRLAAAETAIINRAGAALAISDAEAEILASRKGVRKSVLRFANGVDADYFAPAEALASSSSADVVFIGAMDYRANIDAVMWFASHVWGKVRERAVDATFSIIGARPNKEVKALDGRRGIRVVGRVEDVRPALHGARAVVAPLRIARGIQNKVLEAMAAARPVVATTGANAGIDAAPGREILIADEAADFAAAVVKLLEAPAAGDAIGEAARARVIADFSWSARLAEFDAALAAAGVD